MLPNQESKLSSASIVAKHGTHDQSTHGRGRKTNVISTPDTLVPEDAVDAAVLSEVSSLLDEAERATSSGFPYEERPKLMRALEGKKARTLQTLARKYDNKAYELDIKSDIGESFSEWDNEDLNAWGKLYEAAESALRGIGEEPEI